MEDPEWDGSFLGTVSKNRIVTTAKVGSIVIKLIRFKTVEMWCYTKRTNDDFVCFYDELKPHFGLIKQGSHTIQIEKTQYLICRYRELKKVNPKQYEDNADEIAKIIIYKTLLSVSESLKDIYFFKGKILDLSFGKVRCINNMRDAFIKVFFKNYLDFEKKLVYDMIGFYWDDDEDFMLDAYEKFGDITKGIKYSEIGIDDLIQKILFYKSNF